MSEPQREVGPDQVDGASEPDVRTPHPPWVKIATLVVLGAFLLATLVGALL